MLSAIETRHTKGSNYVTFILPSVCNSSELADYFAIFIDLLIKALMYDFIDIDSLLTVVQTSQLKKK
jgi:hypothetical protein